MIEMYLANVVLLVELFDTVDGIVFMKTHLKGALGFNGFLDLAFSFMKIIWHYLPKGSGSIFS